MSNTDTDKLELAVSSLKGLVNIGETILEDGKVDLMDIGQLKPLADEVQNLIKAVKAYKELGEEIKDIEGAEAARLIAIIFG